MRRLMTRRMALSTASLPRGRALRAALEESHRAVERRDRGLLLRRQRDDVIWERERHLATGGVAGCGDSRPAQTASRPGLLPPAAVRRLYQDLSETEAGPRAGLTVRRRGLLPRIRLCRRNVPSTRACCWYPVSCCHACLPISAIRSICWFRCAQDPVGGGVAVAGRRGHGFAPPTTWYAGADDPEHSCTNAQERPKTAGRRSGLQFDPMRDQRGPRDVRRRRAGRRSSRPARKSRRVLNLKAKEPVHLDDEAAVAKLGEPVGSERIGVAILGVDHEQLAPGRVLPAKPQVVADRV